MVEEENVTSFEEAVSAVAHTVCWQFCIYIFLLSSVALLSCAEDEDESDNSTPVDKTCGDVTCSENEYCDKTVSPEICRETPTGQGASCEI